jgi:biofilm PGA synthesis lipoprotein PgaB
VNGIILVSLLLAAHLYPRNLSVQVHSIGSLKKIDLAVIKKTGIKILIFPVFEYRAEKKGLFFENTLFKIVYPYLEEFQKNSELAEFALCPWMTGRKFSWTDNELFFDMAYENNQLAAIKKYDLFNPEAVKRIVEIYGQLAQKGVEYILIQDDLMLRFNEGFSNWGKSTFRNYTHLAADEKMMMEAESDYHANWVRIKINQINLVLERIVRHCKKINPKIKLGMNIYYETPYSISRSEEWYGHNLAEILDTGIDYIFLMAYHRQIESELKLSCDELKDYYTSLINKASAICKEQLVVKMQLKDWQTGDAIPFEEVRGFYALIPDTVKNICFTPVDTYNLSDLGKIIK